MVSSRSPRFFAIIGLGIILLMSPVVVTTVDLGAQTNYYYVGSIDEKNGSYEVTNRYTAGYDRDVLCWGSYSRACAFETALLDTTENVTLDSHSRTFDRYSNYQFVYHNGTFYEPRASNERLWLEAKNATTVFEATAIDRDELPSTVSEQLEDGQGQIATHADLPEQQLIALGDEQYATLNHDYTDRTLLNSVLFTIEPFLGAGGFLAGFVIVYRGQQS